MIKKWGICLISMLLMSTFINMAEENYTIPDFNQVQFDEIEGVSFQKIVANHNASRENSLIVFELLVGEAVMTEDDINKEEQNRDSEKTAVKNEETSEVTPQTQKDSSSFEGMTQGSQKIPFSEDPNDLYYFMNSDQYDANGGVRSDLLFTIKN